MELHVFPVLLGVLCGGLDSPHNPTCRSVISLCCKDKAAQNITFYPQYTDCQLVQNIWDGFSSSISNKEKNQ